VRVEEAGEADLAEVLRINRSAFGIDEGPLIATLIEAILADPSAQPVLSLLAREADHAVGHILFSAARLSGAEDNASVALLAPLAVLPEAQSRGVGGALIASGLERLAERGVDLVFVLGYPAYYGRYRFTPAGRAGFEASYPIDAENADAWMVQALRPGALEALSGRVQCCAALDKPEYWRE